MAATRKGVKFPSKSLAAFAKKASRFKPSPLLDAMLEPKGSLSARVKAIRAWVMAHLDAIRKRISAAEEHLATIIEDRRITAGMIAAQDTRIDQFVKRIAGETRDQNGRLDAFSKRLETLELQAHQTHGNLWGEINAHQMVLATHIKRIATLEQRITQPDPGPTDPKPDDADRVVLTGEQFAKWMRSTQTLADEDRPGSFPPRLDFVGRQVHEDLRNEHQNVLNDNLRLATENADLRRQLERTCSAAGLAPPQFSHGNDHITAASN